jgi:hypothetical protein
MTDDDNTKPDDRDMSLAKEPATTADRLAKLVQVVRRVEAMMPPETAASLASIDLSLLVGLTAPPVPYTYRRPSRSDEEMAAWFSDLTRPLLHSVRPSTQLPHVMHPPSRPRVPPPAPDTLWKVRPDDTEVSPANLREALRAHPSLLWIERLRRNPAYRFLLLEDPGLATLVAAALTRAERKQVIDDHHRDKRQRKAAKKHRASKRGR